MQGEDRICAILQGIAKECGGALLRNLYVPTGGGRTAEIDAVLVTRKGAFVVEVKNWAGIIHCGSARYNEWSVRPWRKPKAKPLKRFSPIKQGSRHLAAAARYSRTPPSAFSSLIVFTMSAELKKVPPNGPDFTIVREDRLRSTIKMRLRGRQDVLSTAEMDTLVETLKKTQDASGSLMRAHIRWAKQAERKRLAERSKRREADRRRRARKNAEKRLRADR